MSSGELLLTFLVTFLVFGPSKLPMLAEHLGKFIRQFNHMKEQVTAMMQKIQFDEQKLSENRKKAEKADIIYRDKQGEDHEGNY